MDAPSSDRQISEVDTREMAGGSESPPPDPEYEAYVASSMDLWRRVPITPEFNEYFFRRWRRERERNDDTTSRKRARVPASSQAIHSLRELKPGDAGAPADCAVCLQDLDADDKLRAMPCSHAFHQHCIFDWLRRNGVCPLCRHALPGDDQEEEINGWITIVYEQ